MSIKKGQKLKVKSWQERFFNKVQKFDTCWFWLGAISTTKYGLGYGSFYFEGSIKKAHKVLYESLYGKVKNNFDLDHLCRNKTCVNPEHLEVVTKKENTRRGLKGILLEKCKQGHLYNKENTTYYGKSEKRKCKICRREIQQRYRASKKLDFII